MRGIPGMSRDKSLKQNKMESEGSNAVSSDDSIVGSQPIRGRGRGRGRARGRGATSRGRGRPSLPSRRSRGIRGRIQGSRTETMNAISERRNLARDQVMAMNTDAVRDLMLMAAEIYSSMVLDLIQRRDRPGGGYHPQPTPGGPSWCSCGRCREMPTEAEKVCCGKSPDNCVSRTPDFQVVVLDEAVLRVSRIYRQDVLAVGEGDDPAKENRHAGYRQFILWTYGRLGTGVRKVIPSCCVWAIRDRYPDPFGQYIGFVPSRMS